MTQLSPHQVGVAAPCPLCAEAGNGPLGAHSDFGGASIYRCNACSHFYAWPEPSFDELTRHYDRDYAVKRAMYLGPEYLLIMQRRARAQADLISRYASSRGACIDAGCGIGALVAELSGRGWNARGFDGDAEVVRYGSQQLKANIEVGSLFGFLETPTTVDLLCLSHVVEHLSQLGPTMTRIAGSIGPGGYLFVEVPNETSAPQADMESHLQFFSQRSLSAALSASGLEVLFCSGCGPLAHTQPAPAPRTLGGRAARSLVWRARRALRMTDWDGWYDRYHDDGRGIWLRCIARRPAGVAQER